MKAVKPKSPRRRWLTRLWLWPLAALVALLLMLGSIAWWAGSAGSLPRALQMVQRFLPQDQQLVFSDAQGSITGGGRIGRLQWRNPGTTITIDDLRLEWSLRELLHRELRVRALAARQVQVRVVLQPTAAPEPFSMATDVSLPIKLTLPLTIAHVQIETVDEDGISSTQALDELAMHYRYDGVQHALQISSLRYQQSHLQAQLQLHAQDLTLSAQMQASLRDLAPDTPFAMTARLQVKGSLAGGEAAALDLQLEATQQTPDATASAAAAQVHAQATIHPWRQQPAQQIDLQVSGLNAHAFHRLAPVTALHGRATLQPVGDKAGTDWNAVLDFTNAQPGTWDRQHLPVRKFTASAHLSLKQLNIEAARADLGSRTTAGYITLMGQVSLQKPAQSTLQLNLQQVDLLALMSSLPRTAITGPITLKPWQQDSWQAQVDIRNTLPGPLDRDRAPLDRFLADVRIAPERWRVETLALQFGAGRMQLRGEYAPQTQALDLRGEVQRLPLRQIHSKLATDATSQLSGTLGVSGTVQQGLAFQVDLASKSPGTGDPAQRGQWELRSVQTQGTWSPTRLRIARVHLDALQATMDGSDIDVTLPGLDAIKAHVTAIAPGVELAVNAAMQKQSGKGSLSVQLSSARQMQTWLQGLPLIGERLPKLNASGAARLQADWIGGWQQWVNGLKSPATQPNLRLNVSAHTDGLRLDAPTATGGAPTHITVQKLDLDLRGDLAAAALTISGNVHANDTHAVLDASMRSHQLGSAGTPHWNIEVEKFVASANLPKRTQPWKLQLSEQLQINVKTGADLELRVNAGSASLSAPPDVSAGGGPLLLTWEPALWHRKPDGATTLQSTGTATGIQPAWVDALLAGNGEGPLADAGLDTDLLLSGDWAIQMTDSMNIRAHLKRERGDLWLRESKAAAGIRAFDVAVQSADDQVALALNWDTERAGVVTARVGTRFVHQNEGWSLPETAPLSGVMQAHLQDLNAWAFLAPPGWRIQGALDADLRLGGTVQTPQVDGDIEGKSLNFRSVLNGLDLHDGTLRAKVSGSRMEIAELTFQGGTGSRAYVRGLSGNRTQPPTERGSMTASGSIDWSAVAGASGAESGIVMDLRATLQKMQVLVRNDRQVTLSGTLAAGLDQGALRVRGDISVDRASIVLPEASAPTLGDDVVIVRNIGLKNPGAVEARQARGKLQTRKPLDMDIKLDLGRDLALEGQGITTRLEGKLTVRSTAGNSPISVFGEVRTVEGRYRAWGQALNVETGEVRFNGPYINPTLNLLAIRPDIAVRAGVRVTGTLNAPRVQLFSEPDLPAGEKLSWVLLGRAAVAGSAEGSSMQQAALGLAAGQLGGKLASGLGLDELGFGDNGVAIGKRISNELYLTYEAGLSGAASTLFIFYDITRRLTLRAATGEASAVDLVYTITYD